MDVCSDQTEKSIETKISQKKPAIIATQLSTTQQMNNNSQT